MKMRQVRYLGNKKVRRIQLPVPYLSISAADGDVVFEGNGSVKDMPAESAKFLVEMEGSQFEYADVAEQVGIELDAAFAEEGKSADKPAEKTAEKSKARRRRSRKPKAESAVESSDQAVNS